MKRRRGDSIALTKGLLIAAWRHSGDGLALSVCFADTSPKGRGFGIPQRFLYLFAEVYGILILHPVPAH